MKKCVYALCILMCLFGITAVHAEDGAMKLEMNGEVKPAKDIGTGKGISFTLPDLEDPDFYIESIELAVFEKGNGENQWHIYTDSSGNETKKILLEDPQSLNIQADFGDLSQYDADKKYKLVYRYHVQALSDMSKTAVAGADIKDGWRLVGEPGAAAATDSGLVFYKNKIPKAELTEIRFKKDTINGYIDAVFTADMLENSRFPADCLTNGINISYTAEDDDEDISVSYRLETMDKRTISKGPADSPVYCSEAASQLKLVLIVSDPYGASSESEYILNIDMDKPEVIKEFNDMDCYVSGNNLYSSFEISGGGGESFSGDVYCTILKDGTVIEENTLLKSGKNGMYAVDRQEMPEVDYEIRLTIFDTSGNRTEHTLLQKLDATPPVVHVLTPQEDEQATVMERWTNEPKKIIADIKDDRSGLFQYAFRQNGKIMRQITVKGEKEKRISIDIPQNLTGKIQYIVAARDASRQLNKNMNAVTSMRPNQTETAFEVWIDKTPPKITVHHNDDGWKNTPYSLVAEFEDFPSAAGIDDASGIKSKQYAVMENDVLPSSWSEYTGTVELTTGGVCYVYFRAVDNAGNETIEKTKVRMNDKSVVGAITPTEDSMHTIYYSKPGFYVVKNTAYSTRYRFVVQDGDINDVIKTDIRLVSRDNPEDCMAVSLETLPNGTEEREVIFNLSYLNAEKEKLPDGVYDMYYSVTEVKNSGESIKTHDNIEGCRVVIKRSAPPEPVIYTEDGKVKIDYPAETVAGSLNIYEVMSRYKKEYKAVLDGQMETNVYRNYTGEFDMDNMVVTALYTDIAGNTSTASKRIFKDSDGSDTDFDILTDGNNTVVEESRPANVYYIGIRREKQNGINADIFGFMN